MRRSPLKRRSAKGEAYEAEYRAAIPLVKDRSGGKCEVSSPNRCMGAAGDWPHHRKLRSQGGSNSLDNLIDVCWNCHQWIHQVLPRVKAEELGLIIPRDSPETPMEWL